MYLKDDIKNWNLKMPLFKKKSLYRHVKRLRVICLFQFQRRYGIRIEKIYKKQKHTYFFQLVFLQVSKNNISCRIWWPIIKSDLKYNKTKKEYRILTIVLIFHCIWYIFISKNFSKWLIIFIAFAIQCRELNIFKI